MTDPADTFLATLRESLADFDRRLLELERLGAEVKARLEAVENPMVRDARRLSERQCLANYTEDPTATTIIGTPAPQNDDFLAPPLPWWARSPVIG